MKQNRIITLAVFAMIFCQNDARADYLATGKFSGLVCSGFVIQSCSNVSVDAVGENGRLFELKRSWPKVTEFNSSQKLCHIRVKGNSVFGFWGDVVGEAASPDFYSLTSSGKYKKVDIESLSFKCQKR